MKHFFSTLLGKMAVLLEEDLATRDRSPIFRLITLTLVSSTVFYIIFYTVKNIG